MIIQQYFKMLAQHPRFLMFGFLATFFSSFGQTFFLALFTDTLIDAYQLSYSSYGAIYAGATFAGGFLLMRIGKRIDTVSLGKFTAFAFFGFALAAALITWNIHVLVLCVALAGLRLFGQGFMGHIAMTSMGRYFSAQRGKAVAFAGMGFPLAELILPLLIISLLAFFGWQAVWWGVAVSLLLALPLMVYLQGAKPVAGSVTEPTSEKVIEPTLRQRDLLRDAKFWQVLPALLGLPFVFTAVILNQFWLAEQFVWSPAGTATAIAAFSLTRVTMSVFAGDWIDTIGSRKLIGLNIIPLAMGVVLLSFGFGLWSWWAYLALAGISAGINSAISGSLWAEIYGTKQLGTVRALVHALMVFSTGLSPFLMGLMIDWQITPQWMLLSFAGLLVLAWLNARRLPS
ncbi:hypothetical protein IDAT_01255 [Pseudidiomarina atlantica]|uniref:Major facilitator superfamily (MFS) profile domain-containing protein n=1 Tax=Pseudidiomarina atlantica TaxID=1517416 RepID=A0A094IRK2_9GAMM|nr:MFS transporter [Pseudidiomarina atlantica]KFZ29757.1 hypothetical protein IDAT_01255 [Pseudidiomarina atlantica]